MIWKTGEKSNLTKLNKSELGVLRNVVRKVYHQELYRENPSAHAQLMTDRECDKIIESLLPETIETLRQKGIESNWAKAKKFFLPSKIVDSKGKRIIREGG